MFAEDHGIVARHLVFEHGISLVGVAKSTGPVELPLDPAEVAGVAGILVGGESFTEKVVRHVFDGVEAEAVGLGAVELPAGGTNQVAAHIFRKGCLSGIDVFLGLGLD